MVEASISYTESETLYNNLKSQEICCCRCICYSSWFIDERIKVSCIKNIEELWWVIRGINLKWSLKNKKSSKKGLPKFANCFFVRLHTFLYLKCLSVTDRKCYYTTHLQQEKWLREHGRPYFSRLFFPLLKLHISSQMELNYAAQTVYNVHRVRGCTDLSLFHLWWESNSHFAAGQENHLGDVFGTVIN